MQNFDRGREPPPASLMDGNARETKRWLLNFLGQGTQRQSQIRLAMSSRVIEATDLDEAAARLFNGRCAFCERAGRLRAYRFRPIEEAEPADAAPAEDADRRHLYYAWLANAWENIYPICEGCTPAEPYRFPVRGKRCRLPSENDLQRFADDPTGLWREPIAEKPMLLDPCANENYRAEIATLPTGELIGLTSRAAATIGHFKLNRTELLNERRRTLIDRLDELLHGSAGDPAPELFDFRNMEFGGSWFLLLYQMAKLLEAGRQRPRLTMVTIHAYYRDALAREEGPRRIVDAFDRLAAEQRQLFSRRAAVPTPGGSAKPVRVEIINFKAVEKLELELVRPGDVAPSGKPQPIAPAVLILGENSAGKSSILEAIALAAAGPAAREDLPVETVDLVLQPRLMGAAASGPGRTARIRMIYDDERTSELRIARGAFEEEAHPDPAPVFAYGAFRMFLKAGKRPRASARVRSLFAPDYILPNPEVWLASIHGTPAFAEVARALRSILAIGGDFEVIRVDPETRTCSIITRVTGGDGEIVETATPLSVVSSGFRSVLGMACDAMRGLLDNRDARKNVSLANARGTILIDEIEAHLHPRWKMQIVRGLREALPSVTLLATTHDPLCLRDLASGEVVVLRRVLSAGSPLNTELPTTVERLAELPAMSALTIEQLLTSDLFQLFSTDEAATTGSLAEIGDLLAAERSGVDLSPDRRVALDRARRRIVADVAHSLPIGSTEVQRLVQEAVEEYLRDRRSVTSERLQRLRNDTRAQIIRALGRA